MLHFIRHMTLEKTIQHSFVSWNSLLGQAPWASSIRGWIKRIDQTREDLVTSQEWNWQWPKAHLCYLPVPAGTFVPEKSASGERNKSCLSVPMAQRSGPNKC